jgi:DNA-binding transcriptional regulator LsrR (DeoR family)
LIRVRENASAQALLIKEARLARVLELWHVEQLSTLAIAVRMELDEEEVCRLIEEGASQCWRDRRAS